MKRIIAILGVSSVVIACKEAPTSTPESNDDRVSVRGSEVEEQIVSNREELESFLVKGLSAERIIRVLGSPDTVSPTNGTGPGVDIAKYQELTWVYYGSRDNILDKPLVLYIRSRDQTFSTGDSLLEWHYSSDDK